MELEFYADPAAFLDVAGDHLAADPVLSTVLATVATRWATAIAEGVEPDPRDWYAVARDGGEVVGVAMRTAPFGDRPPYLLPMPDEAALALATALDERGEEIGSVNGALPATQVFADEVARSTGRAARIWEHMRLHEVGEVTPARPTTGALRLAREADLELCRAWFAAFHADADEQAGREPGASPDESLGEDDLRDRITRGRIWLWEDAGEVVHMTGANLPAFGVARVGPVYTPREHRGRGYASAAVEQVSRQILAGGARACLFTDQANPTSNKIYESLGYRPVVDMANLRIE
jgi:GNAT superfamily N-acetyltransferase